MASISMASARPSPRVALDRAATSCAARGPSVTSCVATGEEAPAPVRSPSRWARSSVYAGHGLTGEIRKEAVGILPTPLEVINPEQDGSKRRHPR